MTEIIDSSNILKAEAAINAFSGDGLDEILEQIRAAALSEEPDLSTVKGRKAVASRAYAVSRSKVVIDDAGKSITADIKAQVKKVDDARRKARTFCDDLRDEVRKPLTDWEEEQARLEAERKAEEERIAREAEERAEAERRAREAELAERERRVREAEEEQARKEAAARAEEERIAREAEERRLEQELLERAAAERERLQREAAERAEREKEQAVKAARAEERRKQRERADAARRKEQAREAAQRKLEQDERIRKATHTEITAFLIENGLSEASADRVTELLAGSLIPHVRVTYTDQPARKDAA